MIGPIVVTLFAAAVVLICIALLFDESGRF